MEGLMTSCVTARACAALSTALLLVASCKTASAREIYVDISAAAGDGSKTKPYKSLKRALSRAGSGSTLRVAAGKYKGAFLIEGRSVTLLGGFAKGFASRDPKGQRSVLTGAGADSVLTLLSAGKTKVDGFVITGGGGSQRSGSSTIHGGGVYISGGSPTLSNCVIENNRTTRKKGEIQQFGGGVYAQSGSLTLLDNVIRANTAKRGGGVGLMELKRAVLRGNRIEGNVAVGDHGGGVYAACKDLLFERNVLRGNEVGRKIGYGWGGGVTIIGKSTRAIFRRNYLTKNFAASLGSAYFIDDESQATVEQDLIVGNTCAPEGGTAIFVDGLDPTKGSRARIVKTTIGDHPCGGAVAGNAVRADQSSTVQIVGAVLWNNGKKPLSQGKKSTIAISRSLVDDSSVKGDKLVHGKPAFAAPGKGDYRLSKAVDGIKPGVAWSLAEQRKGQSGASVTPPQSKKPTVVAAGAAPSSSPKSQGGAKQDCAVAATPRPTGLAAILMLLAGLALARRRTGRLGRRSR
jgi:hypothetical protein